MKDQTSQRKGRGSDDRRDTGHGDEEDERGPTVRKGYEDKEELERRYENKRRRRRKKRR